MLQQSKELHGVHTGGPKEQEHADDIAEAEQVVAYLKTLL